MWLAIPGGTTNYNSSSSYKEIQSGQSFLVYSTPGSGTVSFTEACKINSSRISFKSAGNTSDMAPQQLLRASIHNPALPGSPLADGNLLVLGNNLNSDYDANDALKMINTNENFGIRKGDKTFAIEARKPVVDQDTVFYTLGNLRHQPYQFKFEPQHISNSATALLVDQYLHTKTPVKLDAPTSVDFEITDEVASSAADRFYLVFKALRPVPSTVVNISASRTAYKAIAVNWKAENEAGISRYELQRSADGNTFSEVSSRVPLLNNGGVADYQYIDENSFEGDNFYRVKTISSGGQVQYSKNAKVAGIKIESGITVNPNPVSGKIINIHFNNQQAGEYSLEMSNKLGQVIYHGTESISGLKTIRFIQPGKNLSSGNYDLKISTPNGDKIVIPLIIQ